MSGRAGRRGKDDRGIVIQMMDEKMEPAVCKGILYGDPDPLNSSYHISYNMLLNMMRVEEVDPEFLIKASFHQFQQESEAPVFESQAEEYERQSEAIEIEDATAIGEYFGLAKQRSIVAQSMMEVVRAPGHIVKFLQPGRLVDLLDPGSNLAWGWGVVTAQASRCVPLGLDDSDHHSLSLAGGTRRAKNPRTCATCWCRRSLVTRGGRRRG